MIHSDFVPLDLGIVHYDQHVAPIRGIVRCGPPLTLHPNTDKLRELHTDWAQRFELARPELVETLKFWTLWTDCCADATTEGASIVPDYCLMYTILDDGAERFFADGDLAALDLALADFGRVFAGAAPKRGVATQFPRYRELCEVVDDLRTRLCRMHGTRLMARFLAGYDQYRRGVIQQAYLARNTVRVSRETQLYNRLLNVAYDPTVILMCMVSGAYFPRREETHPLLGRLHMTICRIGAIVNDIISFPKESRQDEGASACQNLLAATYHEFKWLSQISNPLKTAIERSIELHNLEFADCLELGSHVVQDNPSLLPYVRLGIDMHRSWMQWCLASQRYTVDARSSRNGGTQIESQALPIAP